MRKQYFWIYLILLMSLNLFSIPTNQIITIENKIPIGANTDGSILYLSNNGGSGLYIWTEENGLTTIAEDVIIRKISPSGLLVGEKMNSITNLYQAGYFNENFEWTFFNTLDNAQAMDDNISSGFTVSNDGSIFAGSALNESSQSLAVNWNADGDINLYNTPDGMQSRVNDLNTDGSIAVGFVSLGQRAPAYWDADGIHQDLETYNNTGLGEIAAISPNGEYFAGTSNMRGAVWHDGQAYFFFDPGFQTHMFDVSNNGIAVGFGRNFMQWTESGYVWSEETGNQTAQNYFETHGVDVSDDIMITALNYISDDGSIILGKGFEGATAVTIAVKFSQASYIQGNIQLTGGSGNVQEVNITNGVNLTHPDENGDYSLQVTAGTYMVSASLSGYETAYSDSISIANSQTINDVDFTLNSIDNPVNIHGTITLHSNSGMITDVTITAGNYQTHPDINGDYQLLLPPGTYVINAVLPQHTSGHIDAMEYQAGESYEYNFDIIYLFTLTNATGTISAEGVDDFTVGRLRLGNFTVTPWESGFWGVNFVNWGNYELQCYLPGYQVVKFDSVYLPYDEEAVINFSMENKVYHQIKSMIIDQNLLSWTAPFGSKAYLENFENFTLDKSIGLQHPAWLPSYGSFGGEYDPYVVSDSPINTGQALYITNTDDTVFDLSRYSSGTHYVNFDMFIPTGKAAHFALLHSVIPTIMSFEVFFRENGELNIFSNGTESSGQYQQNNVLHISNKIDLSNMTAEFYINDELITSYQWNHTSNDGSIVDEPKFGFVNFSADPRPGTDESPEFYIDNVKAYSGDIINAEAVYNLYVNDMTSPVVSNVDSLQYKFANLNDGEEYLFGVQAVFPDGGVSEIKTKSFTIINPEEILPPTNLEVSETGLITWNVPRILSGYNVYLDDELIAENISETEYQLTDITPNVTHTIGVSAVYNDSEESEIITTEYSYVGNSNDTVNYRNELVGNYPNPFNPKTNIKFTTAENAQVNVKIYNAKGQLIKNLVNGNLEKGVHNIVWNGKDNAGKNVSSGIYFYKISMPDYQKTKKMLLLK